MPVQISSAFDSGAIETVSTTATCVELALRPDVSADGTRSEFLQWFHFRVTGADAGAELRIINAGSSTYPDGWRDYRAIASWDRRQWERIPTRYDGQVLTIELPSAPGPSYIAYFEPFSWERHLSLLADCVVGGAQLKRLGESVQRRDIDALIVGSGSRPVWIIARQHPGETMAEWFVDGLLRRLLDAQDAVAAKLRRIATLHIVPNMNPDGSVLGNLRTNAAGANLNREWLQPSVDRSPEVKCVRDAIEATGCDAFFDIHGDENLPYVFVAGCEMLPSFTPQQAADQQAFAADFRAASSDFQAEHGYHASKYKDDVLKLASKYIGHTYRCLSLTLEMPFKDNANAPDLRFGWSSTRSARLGAAMLDPIAQHLARSTGSSA